jgi:membrane-bound lytic murein transglycosylase D
MINYPGRCFFIAAILFILFGGGVFPNTSIGPIEIPVLIIDEEIPLPLNQDVLDMIFFFQTERVPQIEKALSLMDRYLARMQEIFREEGIPEVLAYLPFIESAYDPLAKSHVGARGIWQFMPAAAKMYGLKVDYWIDERIDPEKSCRAAAKYLKFYYKKFGDWTLAIASYNAGPTRINRASKKLNTTDFWEIKKSKYIRHQTKSYIPAFIAGVYIAKNPQAFGFKHIKSPLEPFETVIIPDMTELSVIARCAGTDVLTLKRLNPELRRQMTPRGHKDYVLRVPAGTAELFTAEFSKIKPEDRIRNLYYTVKNGDTLSTIAKRYRISVNDLLSVNSLKSTRALKIGSVLIIPMVNGKITSRMLTDLEPVKPTKINDEIKKQLRYSKGEEVNYKIRSGDSLSLIAKRFRTDIGSICEWNGISHESILHPGSKLTIFYSIRVEKEKTTPVKSVNGSFLTYIVQQGDTLYDIAKNYNVSISNLKSINGIRGSRLYPGDKLIIPVEND